MSKESTAHYSLHTIHSAKHQLYYARLYTDKKFREEEFRKDIFSDSEKSDIIFFKCNEALRNSSSHLNVLAKSIQVNKRMVVETQHVIVESEKSLRMASEVLGKLDSFLKANVPADLQRLENIKWH